jgi:Fe-S-cluster containining protein
MNDGYYVYEKAQEEKLALDDLQFKIDVHKREFLKLCKGAMGVIEEDWEKKYPDPKIWNNTPLFIKERLLEIGEVYFGEHRCTNIALWTGNCFIYLDKNMGCWGFEETETLEDRDKKNNYAFFTPFFLARDYEKINYVREKIKGLKLVYKEWVRWKLNNSL